jgi:ABC-2 type transport system ATP-binding protein
MAAVIETHGLTKRYGQQFALKDLDLAVREGEVLGYLGPNGSGKTTTIRLLLGLIRPTSGSAAIFGLDAQSQTVAIHARTAFVPGEANLWPSLTGNDTLELLGRVHGKVDAPYREQLIERFDFDPSKKVRSYSKGNRQKVPLIAALATRADLLILDEPTSGLDPLMEQTFRECIAEAKQRGQTIFLSSHILTEVEALCDRVAILRSGQLLEIGTMADMRHLSGFTVEAIFDGEPPDVSTVPGVRAVRIEGGRLRCELSGDIAPLLRTLANAGIRELSSAKPSLEELFLSHYAANGPAT